MALHSIWALEGPVLLLGIQRRLTLVEALLAVLDHNSTQVSLLQVAGWALTNLVVLEASTWECFRLALQRTGLQKTANLVGRMGMAVINRMAGQDRLQMDLHGINRCQLTTLVVLEVHRRPFRVVNLVEMEIRHLCSWVGTWLSRLHPRWVEAPWGI